MLTLRGFEDAQIGCRHQLQRANVDSVDGVEARADGSTHKKDLGGQPTTADVATNEQGRKTTAIAGQSQANRQAAQQAGGK